MKTTQEQTNYPRLATDFLAKTRTTFKADYVTFDIYFDGDKEKRDIWKITLKRMGKSYTFRFGQSLAREGKEPTAYDVLACLTKSDPGTFENFCGDFGYSTDSRSAEKTYKAVVKEWNGVERLFGDVLDDLQEIA